MIQIINKIGGSMTVKILNMIKTIAVIYVITAIILLGLSFGLYKFNLSEWQIKAGIIITYIISSAVGGFMIGSRQKTSLGCINRLFIFYDSCTYFVYSRQCR